MNLRYITCSDPREDTNITDLINLFREYPISELAIQCHPSKMSYGMPRYIWFEKLLCEVRNMENPINLAVHINAEWADLFCSRGLFSQELTEWFYLTNNDETPVIKRLQINMTNRKNLVFNTKNIAQVLQNYPNREFIFQYNPKQNARVHRLDSTGAKFSVLFDASGGNGITPKKTYAPIFENHSQGYSGGISPENVKDRLNKIATVTKAENNIWVDAEGKLKKPDSQTFDMERARLYLQNANSWRKEH